MIKVTRINGGAFVVNSELIEFIEEKPETIICLTTGKRIMIRESVEDVIDKVAKFKGVIYARGIEFNSIETGKPIKPKLEVS
ncbi:MAG: flagellar protein [candidate division Zixibacteria bacterium]|nr:flagellar protein [candidate division Zixibacteria bacterium]